MSREKEIADVTAEADALLGKLRANVAALNAILATDPEVTGDQPATA
ncbi:MAG TPA: hypothetical protein VGG54_22620 [Trebonia sp.]